MSGHANSTTSNDWGEEVLPGIFLMRKRPAPPPGNGVVQEGDAPLDFQQIYQDIDSVAESIKHLERSNQEMVVWLDEAWLEVLSSRGQEPDLTKHPRPPTGVDHDVEEAIIENIDLLRIKYKRLESLKALVSMHHCTQHEHDHSPPVIAASSWATSAVPAAPTSQPAAQSPANAEAIRRTLPTVGAPGMSAEDEYDGEGDTLNGSHDDRGEEEDEEEEEEGESDGTGETAGTPPPPPPAQSDAQRNGEGAPPSVAKSSGVIYL